MTIFALVDCNNFYASCEKLFAPKLANRPVVVLSNNDGCVVARSAEVKAMGLAMGTPWFKIKDLARERGIVAFSSNYALYADMSNRVVETLRGFSPDMEVYSIDESFLDVTGFSRYPGLEKHGHAIRERVAEWTGLAVCVGFGTSKTLAKLANHCAKKGLAGADGVCDLTSLDEVSLGRLLGSIPVGETWGIGRKLVPKLEAIGVSTVADLRNADPAAIRARFSVVLERIVLELRGTSCLSLEEMAPDKQQIMVSRSFGTKVHSIAVLADAVATHASRAAEKLRAQDSVAGCLTVSIRTSPFSESEPQYARSLALPISQHTADTRRIVLHAVKALKAIYQPGFAYAKAGVMLSEICPRSNAPRDLFFDVEECEKAEKLMATLDAINARWGKETLRTASVRSEHKAWEMNRGRLSPAYTTSWQGLPIVKAI